MLSHERYNKIFTKMWGVYSLLWDTVYIYIYIYICMYWILLLLLQLWVYIYILNKIINATLLFCHFSWAELKDLRLFLCTQKAYFFQILFTNLSKSVLVSTSPLPGQKTSLSGVTTICLMQFNTAPSHRVDQVVDCGLWNVGPFLFNGCAKLLDIGRN